MACRRFAYRDFASRAEANWALRAVVERDPPAVLLGLKLGAIEPATLAAIRAGGVFTALWYVDCFDGEIPDQIARLVPAVDVCLTTAGGMVPRYQALAPTPVHWVMEGAHLPAFAPVDVPAAQRGVYASELAFVGNLLHPPVPDEGLAGRRFRLLARVAERFDLKIWGPQGDPRTRDLWGDRCPLIPWPAYHDELVKICATAGIVLGINTINTVPGYFSNRSFITLAAGGFHLTHYVPGLESFFENHRHLVWFTSDDECLELAAHYLARPEERAAIAAAGRALVHARYGMDRQVERILELIAVQTGNALVPSRSR